MHSENACFTCLCCLGQCDTNWNDPICVMIPKGSRASTYSVVCLSHGSLSLVYSPQNLALLRFIYFVEVCLRNIWRYHAAKLPKKFMPTWFGHLGLFNTKWTNSMCVTSPKEVHTSTDDKNIVNAINVNMKFDLWIAHINRLQTRGLQS